MKISSTEIVTFVGLIGVAAGAVSQVEGINPTVKVISLCVAGVCAAAFSYLAKGRGDTGVK